MSCCNFGDQYVRSFRGSVLSLSLLPSLTLVLLFHGLLSEFADRSILFIEFVTLKLSSTSCIIFSRYKLNNTGDKMHPWRAPTDVRNCWPISPWCSAALFPSCNNATSLLWHC